MAYKPTTNFGWAMPRGGDQAQISVINQMFTAKADEKLDYERMQQGVMEEVRRIFKPEFINRIDEILVFHPLKKADLKKIVTLLAKDLTGRCSDQMEITLTITPAVKEHLIEKYADLKMGARPLKRAIQTQLEDPLAEELLSGRIGFGDIVSTALKDGRIVFVKKANKKG
jgi:ATP-dependent Clp protease ATP-binding subunit ClpC